MLKNYFIVTLRNILKHKFYALINVVGLTIGLASCLLIAAYIINELSFDRFHQDAQDIYRITLQAAVAGQEMKAFESNAPVGPALLETNPGVRDFVRVQKFSGLIVRNEHESFIEDGFIQADSNFFDFFSFTFLHGDKKTALKEPNSIVLTQSMAEKYFGSEDPLNKTLLLLNSKTPYKVTGIAANSPKNSHIVFSGVLSGSEMQLFKNDNWLSNFMLTYVKLHPETSVTRVNEHLENLTAEKVSTRMQELYGFTYQQLKEQGGIYSYKLFPLLDSHLRASDILDFSFKKGDINHVYAFIGIGLFILLIACLNFMSLSTARSAGRAKEVGMRKALGSDRNALIKQFLVESIFYSTLAMVLAVSGTILILPVFSLLSGTNLGYNLFYEPIGILSLLGLCILTGLLAGSYPAFYLTSFNPVVVLKGKLRSGLKHGKLRNLLVVCQFTLSTGLIICTIIVFQQLNFLQNSKMGLDKNQVVVIKRTNRAGIDPETFRNSISQYPAILSTSYCSNAFPGVNNNTLFRGKSTQAEHLMGTYTTDWDHLNALDIKLLAGNFFHRDQQADSSLCVINQAAMHELGLSDHQEEETEISFLNVNQQRITLKVIGVVQDFHFEGFRERVRPLVIRFAKDADNLMVRYRGNPKEVITMLEETWKRVAPDEPFVYSFLDEAFNTLFRTEERIGYLLSGFTAIAIFVSCLGLFALASFTAEQRSKEIAVRKVLGASTSTITKLLSLEYFRIVAIAFILATVPAWYLMREWLNTFAYHVSLNFGPFIFAGLVTLMVAWATIGYQSLKAALNNPIESLKAE